MESATIASMVVLYGLSTVAYLGYLIRQRDALHRWGLGLLLLGFAGHTLLLVALLMRTGHMPVSTLRETLLFAGWTISGVFIAFQLRYRLRVLGVFAAPLAAAATVIAAQVPSGDQAAQPLLKSLWLGAHVLFIFMGEAALALACGLGILYLLQERAIKRKKPGFFFRRLPSLELLDSSGYAGVIAGFVMMTIGLITGVVYAKMVWGRFWSWDIKEVWSGITWLLYAALIHARLSVGWRGRKSAVMAIVGFAVVMFTFLGVNFFLAGHHGDFTRF
jgi:cytochrome c-type biogenesis protein CcsB